MKQQYDVEKLLHKIQKMKIEAGIIPADQLLNEKKVFIKYR